MTEIVPFDVFAMTAESGVEVRRTDLKGKWSAMMIRWDEGSVEIRLERRDGEEVQRLALARAMARLRRTDPTARGYQLEAGGTLSLSDFSVDPCLTDALQLLAPAEMLAALPKYQRMDTARLAKKLGIPRAALAIWIERLGLVARRQAVPVATPTGDRSAEADRFNVSPGIQAIIDSVRTATEQPVTAKRTPARAFGLRAATKTDQS